MSTNATGKKRYISTMLPDRGIECRLETEGLAFRDQRLQLCQQAVTIPPG